MHWRSVIVARCGWSGDMRSAVIGNILKQNPKITTHTGNEPPYGYLDWWPNALWVNTQLVPSSDVRVRRAISLAIDRDQIDEVLHEGAKIATIYPFPPYPGLQRFVDSPAVKALEQQYNPREFNLDKSAQLMQDAGFTRNADGLWEKDGQTVDVAINGFEDIHGDSVPVLVEMLKAGVFDASAYFRVDAYQHMHSSPCTVVGANRPRDAGVGTGLPAPFAPSSPSG